MKLTIKEIQDIETEMLKEVHEICERNGIDYYLAYGSVLGAVRHGGPIPWDTDLDIIVPIDQFDKLIICLEKHLDNRFYVDYYISNKNYRGLFPRVGLRNYSTKTLHIDIFKLIGAPSNKNEQRKFKRKLESLTLLYKIKKSNKEFLHGYNIIKRTSVLIMRILLTPITSKSILNRYERLCNLYNYKNSNYVVNANGYGMKEFILKTIYGIGGDTCYDQIIIKIPEQYKLYLEHFYNNYMQLPDKKDRVIEDTYLIREIDEQYQK